MIRPQPRLICVHPEGRQISVIWAGKGEAMDTIGLTVTCHLCNAAPGEPCSTRIFQLHRGYKTHVGRHDLAEAFGFRLATGSAGTPAKAPARAATPTNDLFEG